MYDNVLLPDTGLEDHMPMKEYKHEPIRLIVEYCLSYIAILLSLAMVITISQMTLAVHSFGNLEKLMGQFISHVSRNNDD